MLSGDVRGGERAARGGYACIGLPRRRQCADVTAECSTIGVAVVDLVADVRVPCAKHSLTALQILSRGADCVSESVPIYDVAKGVPPRRVAAVLSAAVPAVHLGVLQVTFECIDALRALIKRKGE